jgi:pyridoxamine 5'-phosphate oxidase
MDLEQIRREYLSGGLRRENLHQSPFEQFDVWLRQAVAAGIADPTAMVLATVDEQGQPDQRLVLLKQSDPSGLVFYTNYSSKKAHDISGNPKVSLHFPWYSMERQVRISGTASRVSLAESIRYFTSRPLESQIAAWASQQSAPISSRRLLLEQFERMKEKFREGKVPLPDFWGGFRVVPHRFEFWQGGASRLHDRFEYLLTADGRWAIGRLAP